MKRTYTFPFYLLFGSILFSTFPPSSLRAQGAWSAFDQALTEGNLRHQQAKEYYRTHPHDSTMLEFLMKEIRFQENRLGVGSSTLAQWAIALADSLGDQHHSHHARIWLGKVKFRMGYYLAAEQLYKSADTIPTIEDPGFAKNRLAGYLATVYTYQGAYDEAIRYFIEQEHYYKMTEKPAPFGPRIQLSFMYFLQGDYQEALRINEAATQHVQGMGTAESGTPDHRALPILDAERGVIFLGMGKVEEAIPLIRTGLDVYTNSGDWRGMAYHYHNLGEAYFQLQQPDSAAYYYHASKRINSVLENRNMLAQTYLGLGRVSRLRGQNEEALAWLHLGIETAQQSEVREVIKNTLKELGHLHQAMGNAPAALSYFHQYDSVSTQIIEESQREMRHLVEEFYWDLHEQEVAAVEEEARLYSRLSASLAAGVFLSLCLLGLMINRYRLRADLANRKQQALVLEKENARLAQEKLQTDLDYQQRELASATLHAMQKNEILCTVQSGLLELASQHPKAKSIVRQLSRTIEQGLQQDRDWEHFKLHFERVHPAFFDSLKQGYPQLSSNDLKHCAYLRINLSVKEVAQMLGIAANSVTMNRYRLKKKLGLPTESSLGEFIATV